MRLIIGASKNNLIGSKLIRWWIGAPYSHVYSRWEVKTQQRDIVYQASHGMVHFQSADHFTRDNEVVEEIELELTSEQFANFSRKCIDLAGEKYSKMELLQLFLRDLSKERLSFGDQPGYICSELMAELLQDIGLQLPKPKHMMNPKDIMDLLRKNKESLA